MATIYKRGGKGQRGGRYYISYFDHKGKRQSRSARTSDKATAERIAAKLEADAKQVENEAAIASETERAVAEQELQALRAELEKLRLECDVILPAEAQRKANELRARAHADAFVGVLARDARLQRRFLRLVGRFPTKG